MSNVIESKKKQVDLHFITDVKDFKKVLRTNKNVLLVVSKEGLYSINHKCKTSLCEIYNYYIIY